MRPIGAAILFAGLLLAQRGGGWVDSPTGPDLPNAAQRAEISKERYKKNVEEADKLLRLAMELKTDLDQQAGPVVSARTAKDALEIKKLADSIAKRLKSN